MVDLARILEVTKEIEDYRNNHKLEYYDPYPYQKAFHDTGKDNAQRLLMAGNRVGKTFSGAAEMAMHLTGLYPDWWEGRRFTRPITAWACGIDNIKTRDIPQKELLGPPGDPTSEGTGAIPKECIHDTRRKPGVMDAYDSALIKHYTNGVFDGYSRLGFKSYEMGPTAFMGESLDVIWLDEEPHQPVYSQALTRIIDRGGMVYMTFTPENGMTQTVAQFMNNRKPGQSLTRASWDDASEKIKTIVEGRPGHLNKAIREQILESYLPHERDMRSKGQPVLGSGLVWQVEEKQITCEPFEIPDYFQRIAAIDFGWDHATAVVWIAINRDTDVVYLYDCWKEKKQVVPIIAAAINSRPNWIPVIWPHDGNRQDGMGGPTLADQYRKLNVKMHYTHFTNPPAMGQEEGQGGNLREPGIMEVLTRMRTGRFKVFSTLLPWFQEWRMYYRKDGKIVDVDDDLMSATRYAVQSLRFARIENVIRPNAMAETEFNVYG